MEGDILTSKRVKLPGAGQEGIYEITIDIDANQDAAVSIRFLKSNNKTKNNFIPKNVLKNDLDYLALFKRKRRLEAVPTTKVSFIKNYITIGKDNRKKEIFTPEEIDTLLESISGDTNKFTSVK